MRQTVACVFEKIEEVCWEEAILHEFQNGRVDGILISVSGETINSDHIKKVMDNGIPVLFFDRICEDVKTARIITDDEESGYKATAHLVERGCREIAFLCISSHLSISNSRLEGYKKALAKFKMGKPVVLNCNNSYEDNYSIIKEMLGKKNRPDGIIACVEKLTTPVYLACNTLKLRIPADVKVISFTNLTTALILDPPLTTITQPAYEMGKAAATVLFKALGNSAFDLTNERVVISSSLVVRDSTR